MRSVSAIWTLLCESTKLEAYPVGLLYVSYTVYSLQTEQTYRRRERLGVNAAWLSRWLLLLRSYCRWSALMLPACHGCGGGGCCCCCWWWWWWGGCTCLTCPAAAANDDHSLLACWWLALVNLSDVMSLARDNLTDHSLPPDPSATEQLRKDYRPYPSTYSGICIRVMDFLLLKWST